MLNCKDEFLEHTKGLQPLCAHIYKGDPDYYEEVERVAYLKVGYTSDDFLIFLKEIDFEYDNGFGGQEVFGTIWYTDGTWSERTEYDGSEWWARKKCPQIPDCLK